MKIILSIAILIASFFIGGYLYMNNTSQDFIACLRNGGLWDDNSCVESIEKSVISDAQKIENAQSEIVTEPFAITSLSVEKDAQIKGRKTLSGKTSGAPFFENIMPVHLIDSEGKVVATYSAKATSDTSSQASISFTVDIDARKAAGGVCILEFVKQNMEKGGEEVYAYPLVCE